jgi:UDP-N-acetylmuramoyl-L-alanyl-D-glutamate--2,6-diaminopimelate ligase
LSDAADERFDWNCAEPMLLGSLAADLTVPDGARPLDIRGITSDSRGVGDGFLFAALPGTTTDGARFAAAAVAGGAAAILAGDDAEIAASGVPVLRAADPRRAFALLAARFYPLQPERLVAVTGTSGKTSVAEFTRQIFAAAGKRAASIGTLGIVTAAKHEYGTLTTPDTVKLHRDLDRLAGEGITHVAVEASSHGLDQRRLDGLRLTAAAFTNLGRDHMDYHPTVADYLNAKLRLFRDILPATGTAVIAMDGARAEEVLAAVGARGQKVIRTGIAGEELRLAAQKPEGFSQRLHIVASGRAYDVLLPLAGAFQASNALVAAGLAIAAGIDVETALTALGGLKGAPGRLELVGRTPNAAMVFVDYAHKPEAIVNALAALRPMTAGRLIVVIGAGGDRDPGKRPLMGKAAAENADIVIVTDDNPRSEDPGTIRRAVLAGAPDAIEIGDRGEAIASAVAMLQAGDVLCIAGKGHETGQIVGRTTLPFSDSQRARQALGLVEAA